MGYISTLLTIFSLLPNLFSVIDDAVKSVENQLQGVPGISGSQKLAAATTKVNAALTAAGADLSKFSAIEAVLTPMINAAVAVFNSLGLFKKAAPAPAAV